MIGVAEHWEVAAPRQPHSRCEAQWREIDAYHRSKGYSMVAYNHGACDHGGTFVGRGWGVPSAANGTKWANLNFFAVCAMTGPGQPHSPALRGALDRLTAEGLRRSSPPREVSPHSRFFATACPGDTIRSWITAGLGTDGEEPDLNQIQNDVLADTYNRVKALQLDVDDIQTKLAALPAGGGTPIDEDALVDKIVTELAARLQN